MPELNNECISHLLDRHRIRTSVLSWTTRAHHDGQDPWIAISDSFRLTTSNCREHNFDLCSFFFKQLKFRSRLLISRLGGGPGVFRHPEQTNF